MRRGKARELAKPLRYAVGMMRNSVLDRSHDRFAVPARMFDEMNEAREREHPRETLHRFRMENYARAFFYERPRMNPFGKQFEDVTGRERQPPQQPRARQPDGGFVLLVVNQLGDRADETMRHVKRRFCTGVPPLVQRLRDEQVGFGNRRQLRMLAERSREMRGKRKRRAQNENWIAKWQRGLKAHSKRKEYKCAAAAFHFPLVTEPRTSAENSRSVIAPAQRAFDGVLFCAHGTQHWILQKSAVISK